MSDAYKCPTCNRPCTHVGQSVTHSGKVWDKWQCFQCPPEEAYLVDIGPSSYKAKGKRAYVRPVRMTPSVA